MTKPRAKPSSPAEIALRRETARLEVQGEVRVIASPAHEIIAAQRMDVFELLRSRKDKNKNPLLCHVAYEAVRRLERDMNAADGGENLGLSERVDTTLVGAHVYHRLAARARAEEALGLCRPGSRSILEALLRPQFAGILTRWRQEVQKVTGQTREEVITDRVRQAAENLAEAYHAIDYPTQRRA